MLGSAAVEHLLQQVALLCYSFFWTAGPGCLSLGWVNVGGPGPVGPTGGFGLEGLWDIALASSPRPDQNPLVYLSWKILSSFLCMLPLRWM